MILVLHFNAFTGQLDGGYLAFRSTMKPVGARMNAVAVLAYMAANPDARCAPLMA